MSKRRRQPKKPPPGQKIVEITVKCKGCGDEMKLAFTKKMIKEMLLAYKRGTGVLLSEKQNNKPGVIKDKTPLIT